MLGNMDVVGANSNTIESIMLEVLKPGQTENMPGRKYFTGEILKKDCLMNVMP